MVESVRQITCDKSKMIDRTQNVLRKEAHVTLNLLTTWSLYCQPKQCTTKGEIPQNYHIFVLFDPSKIGRLMLLISKLHHLEDITTYIIFTQFQSIPKLVLFWGGGFLFTSKKKSFNGRFHGNFFSAKLGPKNQWTLQWRGLNSYSRSV